jgi:hypothetical protein
MKVLERREFRERERTNREQIHTEIPWFGHEDLRPHTKTLGGYIFTIFLDGYNETQVGYIY